MTFANRLAYLMKEEGVSAYKLSLFCPVSKRHIEKLLAGKSQPTIGVVEKLSAALLCDPGDLAFGPLQ